MVCFTSIVPVFQQYRWPRGLWPAAACGVDSEVWGVWFESGSPLSSMPTWCILVLSCWIALVGRPRRFCAELVRCYTLLLKECRRGAANRERVLVDARGREKKLPLVHCTVHRWGLASLVRLWESPTFLSGSCQNARWEMLASPERRLINLWLARL